MENLKEKKEALGPVSEQALQTRLEKLEGEWKKGQALLARHKEEVQKLQTQLLHIEGAMALARELLGKKSPEAQKN